MTDPRGYALVGHAVRFPGASNSAEFWKLLAEGREAVSEVPAARWDVDAFYDPDPDSPGKMVARRAGFIDDVAGFDAPFFGISRREAEFMDPQHRLLLETTWSAIEHAGIAPSSLSGTDTGVFVGLSTHEFGGMLVRLCEIEDIDIYSGTGTSPAAAAGRISYRLGLQGPAVIVDTACSSSLVAVHQACQALDSGDCDLAVVAGVNVILTPVPMINFSRARMLAPDGHCKTFDESADGYVRGEGCGVVVLKRLPAAIADRDPIRAVIRGTAVNQDGASGGLTVPNGVAQQRVIAKALRRAGIAPSEVDYLEAHGTGTSLGDPIEVQAANEVFSPGRNPDQPLLIGSVKTNIGHLEAASGIAGIIKVALALEHEMLPEHLHFKHPSPRIPWDRMPVRVVDEALPWKRNGRPRTAGVSSFGFSGTNAHVIVEEAPALDASIDPPAGVGERGPHVLPLSARNREGLLDLAARYRDWLDANPDAALSDVCATARTGRAHFEHRTALVVDSRRRARRLLRAVGDDRPAPGLVQGTCSERPKTAWLFGGQGTQFAGMARELFEAEPVFADTIDRCAVAAEDILGRTLTSVLFDHGPDADATLRDTRYAQPALFAVEMGLARLWQSWGVEPDVVFGHSVGQYAAACVAGVFDVEDGARLVAERGRVFGALPTGGRMAAVFADAERVEERASEFPRLSIAAYNGANTVVAGPASDVEQLVAAFEDAGDRCEMLTTSHAFHSALLDPVLDQFEQHAALVTYAAPRIALICNRTGAIATKRTPLDAQYWRKHARHPVRFAEGVATLAGLGCGVVMDLGPEPVLTAAAMRVWPKSQTQPRTVVSMRRDTDSHRTFTEGLAAAYVAGHSLTSAVVQPRSHRVVDLPTYPFQHRDYWFPAITHLDLDRGAQPHAASPESSPISAGSDVRLETLLEAIREELAAALHAPVADLDGDTRFVALGMDSLIALDLCQRLHARLGAEVPAAMFFAHPTIVALADALLIRMNARSPDDADTDRISHRLWSGRAPLSHAQEQLWFLHQLVPSSVAYNVSARIDIAGAVDRESLRRSLEAVVARHDALRTSFGSDRGVPYATVSPTLVIELPFERLEGTDVTAALHREAAVTFDIESGPLIRAKLFGLADDHVLIVTMHHIVTDGWSFGVLLRELASTYEAMQRGLPDPLPELPIQYPDYAQWQRDRLSRPDYQEQLDFWRNELADATPLELDADRPRPKLPTFTGSRKRFELGATRAAALRELCRAADVMVSVPLLAALAVMLQRYSGQDDIVVGTLSANRSRAETQDLIGLFVNALPVRIRLEGDPPIATLLDDIRRRMVDVLAHQDVPFDHIVTASAPGREANRNPLFGVQLVVQPGLGKHLGTLGDLGLAISELETHTAKRDLTFTFTDDEMLSGHIEYASEIFHEDRIDRMLAHFVNILDAVIADVERPLSALPMLDQRERNLHGVARHGQPANASSVGELFASAVDRMPDSVAVTDGQNTLTYRELDCAANELARRLIVRGVTPGATVGLRVGRSVALAIGMLGILKAGAGYVPVDPTHPADRTDAMLSDSDVSVLLNDDDVMACLGVATASPGCAAGGDALAYVMYTSGSTGQPKAVAVAHRSVVEYVQTLVRELGITADDVYLETASCSFSSSIRQLLVPLSVGATVVIASATERRDPAALLRRITDAGVTVVDLVPAVVRGIVDTIDGEHAPSHRMRLLLTASEPLRTGLVRDWRCVFGDQIAWVNMYGQTETTGIVSLHPVVAVDGDDRDIVPIGRPRANVGTYVLDGRMRPVPPGVRGELFISGAALARGYVNDQQLTAQKFVVAPWDPGERLYASGDVVRLASDGTMEFCNRTDRQVKIRGLRVEPAEVDRVLMAHPSVADAVTITQRSPRDEDVLVAYYSRTTASASVNDLRSHARRELPEHLVPAAFVELDRLPLTSNGKLDRSALPPATLERDEHVEYVAPRTRVEQALAEIWRDTLGVDRVGVGDNFFALGGHSLLAAQVRSRIHHALGIELSLDALFDDQTLAELARAIEEFDDHAPEAPPLVALPHRDATVASYAQELMWQNEQAAPGSPEHWIDVAIRITGRLDTSLIDAGLKQLAARHGLLRSLFRMESGSLHQIPRAAEPEVQAFDTDADAGLAAVMAVEDEWRDLDTRPPLRADVFRIADDHHLLRLRIHRILGDGYSTRLLLSEVGGFAAEQLGVDRYDPIDATVQYADFATWERSWLTGSALNRRIDHFRRQFGCTAIPSALPTDHPRTDRTVRYGRQIEFDVPRAAMAAARALAVAQQASLYTVLVSAFARAVGTRWGRRTVALAGPVARRNDRTTQLMLGPFTNTVPLLIDLDAAPDLTGLVRAVKPTVLGALANQDAPWQFVRSALLATHGQGAEHVGQLGFLMDDPVPGEFSAGGFRLTRIRPERVVVRRELTASLSTKRGQLTGMVTYDDSLFEHSTIQRIIDDFVAALHSLAPTVGGDENR